MRIRNTPKKMACDKKRKSLGRTRLAATPGKKLKIQKNKFPKDFQEKVKNKVKMWKKMMANRMEQASISIISNNLETNNSIVIPDDDDCDSGIKIVEINSDNNVIDLLDDDTNDQVHDGACVTETPIIETVNIEESTESQVVPNETETNNLDLPAKLVTNPSKTPLTKFAAQLTPAKFNILSEPPFYDPVSDDSFCELETDTPAKRKRRVGTTLTSTPNIKSANCPKPYPLVIDDNIINITDKDNTERFVKSNLSVPQPLPDDSVIFVSETSNRSIQVPAPPRIDAEDFASILGYDLFFQKNVKRSRANDSLNRSAAKKRQKTMEKTIAKLAETSLNNIPSNNLPPLCLPPVNLPPNNVPPKNQPPKKNKNPFATNPINFLQQLSERTTANIPNKVHLSSLTKKRMVIVDGSNVAFAHSNNREFSVRGLQICIDYFEKLGHEIKAVVPQMRLKRHMSSNADVLERLHRAGKVVLTPCKSLPGKNAISYDDRFILELADLFDAAVISNDNYRDLLHENLGWNKIVQSRVIGYTWCNDVILFPKDPYGRNGPMLHDILNKK